ALMESLSLTADTIGMLSWVTIIVAVSFISVVLATLCDLASALRKARAEGRRLNSRGLRRTVDKLLRYLLTLMGLGIVDGLQILSVMALRVTMEWRLPVLPVVTVLGALAMCLIEVKSIMENTQRRSDFTAVVNSATDLLKDPAVRELLDAIRKIKP
ncbi:MAG: phage holin family protein, partial [Paramuribaculum sp.]|nr:phage holin family protein [Paramuribaculum sp.]